MAINYIIMAQNTPSLKEAGCRKAGLLGKEEIEYKCTPAEVASFCSQKTNASLSQWQVLQTVFF